MTMPSARSYIAELQGKINSCLAPLMPDGPFALLDFPDIRNVGDSAIWIGEMRQFAMHGRHPAYVSRLHDLDARRLVQAVPSGPIFLHGGGNFGDIWIGHQRFREAVIRQFPDRQIVQLPQSIHFESEAELERSASIINSHGNFVLLVRDKRSEALARKHFECQVALCPDMAFAIGALTPLTTPKVPILAMLRKDKERASGKPVSIDESIPVQDWIDEPPLPIKLAKILGTVRGLSGFGRNSVRLGRFDAAARQRFQRGVYQLSRAEVVVTDRLHVHIISLLLGLPHAVLDNSYGKIAGFRDAFPEPPGLAYAASSLEDAVAWASRQVQP